MQCAHNKSRQHGAFCFAFKVCNFSLKIICMAMSWATRRKLEYLGIIIICTLLFLVLPFFLFVYEAPTCFDGQRNGNETGVDCGGSCRLLCSAEILEPFTRWDPRIFEVTPGVYSVLAYIENPNASAEVRNTPYIFRLYDAEGMLVMEREGRTFIPKGKTFAIYDGNFTTGERVPVRATFEFPEPLVWTRSAVPDPDISVTNKALLDEDTSPRVEARVENRSSERIVNLELVAIIFDGSGNAIGSSRTFVDELPAWQSTNLVFTWPVPFLTEEVACSAPIDVALVIDRSGSMASLGNSPPQPLTDVKEAAVFFTNELREGDQGALVSFAGTASSPIDSPLTPDLSLLQSAIESIAIHSAGVQHTNIGDGLLKAFEELTSENARAESEKAIVLLTDGVATMPTSNERNDYPDFYAREVAEGAREAGINIFTIGLGKDVNADFLRGIASSTSEFYSAPSTEELTGIYENIATKLCTKRPAVIEIIPRIYPVF